MRISKFTHPKRLRLLLILFVLFGGILRFTQVNWDNFGAFHPDERNISWAVTRINFFSKMDPQFFAYGGLPIYLYRALGEGVVRITRDPTWLYDWGHIAVIGRYVSAILSTISIALIFLVGTEYFSPDVGFISAFLLACSPWAVQQAHFETTETMLVFFALLMTHLSHAVFTQITRKKIFLLGLVWGLALAAKTTAILFGVIPALALWLPLLDNKLFTKKFYRLFFTKIFQSAFLLGITVVTFFLFSPYTILDFKHFNESMTYESGVALGRFTVPYTLQFWHTIPYVYQLVTMLWQAGPLVIVGLAGLVLLIASLFRKQSSRYTNNELRWTNLLFLIFPVVYFGWVGTWFAKFSRYNVPFLPFVTVAAAWACLASIKRSRVTGLTLTAIVLSATLIWGLANWSVYLRPQTKDIATSWIINHIRPDAVIYTEHWNDGLPLEEPDIPTYNRSLLTVYDMPDNDTKRAYYADKLAAGDYVILSTRRIWATMPRLTDKYPVTSLFYKKLLTGALGYKEVATFTSYPQLFGILVNDDTAEESIQVFDHPTVRIFQNITHYPQPELLRLLRK